MIYKNHKRYSRKGVVRLIFDLYGEESAQKIGEKFNLSPLTLEVWFRIWRAGDDAVANRERVHRFGHDEEAA